MIRYRVMITKPAELDLKGIADYISKEIREPATAQQVVNAIGESVFALEQLPLRNPLVRDERLASQGIRMMIAEGYIIFYFVDDKVKTVNVVRILYGKREWMNIL